MPIIHLLVVLIVVGFLLWLVNNYIPMAGSIKRILNIVVVIAVVLWLLNAFGILLPSPISAYKSSFHKQESRFLECAQNEIVNSGSQNRGFYDLSGSH